MTASIDVSGLTKIADGLRRATSGSLQKDLTNNLQESGPSIAGDIKGAASSGIERKAAASVSASRVTNGITIQGGNALFNGGEYGGRASKKRFYAEYKVYGRPALAVSKRATMQFKPHLGNVGYFFWPTIREWMPKLEKQADETVEKALGGR